mmetsp:Transcript_93934/g.262871  ORF Transcript_93934/g.262871 Transcript_93934/m.262871 type:complete len:267 (+) Transcript_93934:16-816(+)
MSLARLLYAVLPVAAAGARVRGPEAIAQGELGVQHLESYGVPKLEVLSTSNDTEAAAFLAEWSSAKNFGVLLQLVPGNRGFFPLRVGLVGISRGTRVLLFDLKPHLRENPRPLPRHLGSFLANESRTFFGLGIQGSAGHWAFEFDAVVRFVDYKVRGWKQMNIEGGLFDLSNLYFGTHWKKRPSMRTLKGQAVYTYLQWAVVEYFTAFYGKPEESWVLTKAELFAYPSRSVRLEKRAHNWDEARESARRAAFARRRISSGTTNRGT